MKLRFKAIALTFLIIFISTNLISCKSSSSSSSTSSETSSETSSDETSSSESNETDDSASSDSSTSDSDESSDSESTESTESSETTTEVTPEYKLKITITGLEGDVELQESSSSESVSSSTNETVQLTNTFESGETYSVSVSSDPINQECVLDSSSGTFSDADVTLTVTCTSKSWTHPSAVSEALNFDYSTDEVFEVKMSGNKSGDLIVAWTQVDADDGDMVRNLYVATYIDGTWTKPTLASENINPSSGVSTSYDAAYEISVEMNEDSDAMVVWRQKDTNGDSQIFVSHFKDGSWTHPTDSDDNLSPDTTGATKPSLAFSDNGNAVVAWVQNDSSSDKQVYISEYKSGSWTNPSGLNDFINPTGSAAANYAPSVDMNDDGNAVVTYVQENSSGDSELFVSLLMNGTWSHPATNDDYISPQGGNNVRENIAKINNSNEILIAYIKRYNGEQEVYYSEYDGSTWSHPTDMDDFISFSDSVSVFDIALNDDGDAMIIWNQTSSSGNYNLFLSHKTDDSWDHPTDNSDTIGLSSSVDWAFHFADVEIDKNGQAIIAFLVSGDLQFAEYRNSKWQLPTDLTDHEDILSESTGVAKDQDGYSIVMDDNGNAHFVGMYDTDELGSNAIFYSSFK